MSVDAKPDGRSLELSLKLELTPRVEVIDPKEAGTIAHLFRLHGVHIGGTLGHDGRHVKWTNRSLTAAQVANGSVATSTTRTDRPLRFKVRPNGGEHNIHLHLVFYPLRSVQANIEPLLPLMYTPKEPPPKPFASLVPLFSSISLDPPNLAIVLPSSQYGTVRRIFTHERRLVAVSATLGDILAEPPFDGAVTSPVMKSTMNLTRRR